MARTNIQSLTYALPVSKYLAGIIDWLREKKSLTSRLKNFNAWTFYLRPAPCHCTQWQIKEVADIS